MQTQLRTAHKNIKKVMLTTANYHHVQVQYKSYNLKKIMDLLFPFKEKFKWLPRLWKCYGKDIKVVCTYKNAAKSKHPILNGTLEINSTITALWACS